MRTARLSASRGWFLSPAPRSCTFALPCILPPKRQRCCFTHPGTPGCSHDAAIVNSTGGQRRFETLRPVLWGICPEAGLLDRPAAPLLTSGGATVQSGSAPAPSRVPAAAQGFRFPAPAGTGRAGVPQPRGQVGGGPAPRADSHSRGTSYLEHLSRTFGQSQNLFAEMSTRVLRPLWKGVRLVVRCL